MANLASVYGTTELLNKKLSYMCGEWLVCEHGGPCVWDSHEGRVTFKVDSAIVVRLYNMDVVMM